MAIVGIDIGGTKIEAVLYEDGRVKSTCRIPTEADKPYKHILANIVSAVEEVRTTAVTAVGVAAPGFVANGKLFSCKNIPAFEGKPVAKDLQKLLGLPLTWEHDAKCFAYAEAVLGAGKHKQHVVGVVVGTGVGAGIVVQGSLLKGTDGAAGEIGHAPYKDSEYEFYIAGPSVQRMYREAGGLQPLAAGDILAYRKPLIGRADPTLAAAQERFYEALAKLTATLIQTLNPEVIVYGGGVSKSIDYKRLTKETKRYCHSELFSRVTLTRFKIADSAGSIGAALLAQK